MILNPERQQAANGSMARSLFILLLLLAAGAWPSAAGTSELNGAGVLHSVAVEKLSGEAQTSGTRLVHRMQSPAEAIQTLTIPGTDDTTVDTEPAIAIFPASGLPVVVWSRKEGADYEIDISYFDGTRWTQARTLTANSVDDRRPQAFIGRSGYLHLVWAAGTEFDSSCAFHEAILDQKGLIISAPKRILLAVSGSVSTAAGIPPTIDPTGLMIAIDASTKTYTQVCVFGGMDEPIPVGQKVTFEVPGVAGVQNTRIESFGRMTTVTILSGTRLYYSIQTVSEWTPLRSILLDGITREEAELMVKRVANSMPTP